MAAKKKPAKKKSTKLRALTAKELAFADLVISGLRDNDAYAQAYSSKGNKNTIKRKAHTVRHRPQVKKHIADARKKVAAKVEITAEDLIKELEEARGIARAKNDGSAMARATMGKATLLGLDKKVIEIQNAAELTPWGKISAGIDAT